MEIERDFTQQLLKWQKSKRRKPLLLKGVRQCGKSWILTHFGQKHFQNYVYFNFERQHELKSFFEQDYDPKRILQELSAFCGEKILPQKTFIILDEIQLCPRALNSLKYFCEEVPEYAIAAAGSLIGVSLASKGIGFPVGKVDIRELTPCSFHEYLRAVAPAMSDYTHKIPLAPIPEAMAQKLSGYFRGYLTFGGMPGILSKHLENGDADEAENELDSILLSYEADFSRHIPASDIAKLSLIWHAIPNQFAKENKRFIYNEVRDGARAKDLEDAMQWLVKAAMVQKVACVTTPEIPLSAAIDRKTFKLYPTDVGILRKMARIPPGTILNSHDIFADFKGKLAENFVLEQLYAMNFSPICYWNNPRGTAEVDFIVQGNDSVLPIEVKSGLNLNAKSLKLYREKYMPKLSIRTSLQNLRRDDGLLNLPLYLIHELPRFLSDEC